MRNVVMVTFDSLRADHCSFMGYDRETTPALDSMAERGVAFENAVAPASRTNPSMAGTLTGEPLVVRDRVANPEHSRWHIERHGTVAEAFSERGYATGAFCPNAYSSRYYGFDRGFDHFEDFLFDNDLYQRIFEKHVSSSGLVTAFRNVRNFVRRQEAFKTWDTYVDDVESWVDEQNEPFFLWVFSLDTHFPYITPRSYRQWGSLVAVYYYNWRCNQLIDEFDIDVSREEMQSIVDIYDDSVYFADHLVRELRARLSDYDPVFVVFGDHGEAFGERDVYGHFYPSLYEENIHVPLVVGGPGVERRTVRRPASLLDVPRIVRELGPDGGDLSYDGSNWVTATDYDGRNDRNLISVRTADWKYVLATSPDGSDRRELYHLAEDPSERNDLSGVRREGRALFDRLAERRRNHERELLEIRRNARDVADDGERDERRGDEPELSL